MGIEVGVSQGPLADAWAGIGLIAFYIGLVWINTLLGVLLTPLFIIPTTWFFGGKREGSRPASEAGDPTAARRR